MNNYSYDALHRITAMHNSLIRPGLAADNAYSTSYSYDPAGNIQRLSRRGFVGMSGATPVYDLIDDLHYSYAPGANPAANAFSSKLQGVDDEAGAAAQPHGVVLQSSGYGYDGNGNMIGAGSVSAEYNILNLPTVLSTSSGDRKFEYVFGGGKYSAQLITGNQAIDEMRHYIGGMEFKNGILEAYNFGDGRVVFHDSVPTLRFQYRLHDHLGNTVVFFEDKNNNGCITTEEEATSAADLEIIQRLLYYPFGMALEGLGAWSAQPWQQYRYNGKERDTLTGWYEYGFRWYIDGIGRFTGVDPIADRFAHVSVYNYAENEPVGHIDLWGLQRFYAASGEAVRIIGTSNQIRVYNEGTTGESKPLHLADNSTQGNVIKSINASVIKPRIPLTNIIINWGTKEYLEEKSPDVAQTWGPGNIAFNTLKKESGEYLLDDYYNLVNTLVHEDEHSSGGKGKEPFIHFAIGMRQGDHSSFKNTTTNYKSLYYRIMKSYLKQQEKVLDNLGGNPERFKSKLELYKKNVKYFNEKSGQKHEYKKY